MRTFTRFENRRDAGRQLAARLQHLSGGPHVIVLALPRGGVPVAFEVAKRLREPLDVFVVRKLGVPQHEEYAMGAVASGGVMVLNSDVIRELGISRTTIDLVRSHEEKELARREALYRHDRVFPPLRGSTVILVDDGIATGASMIAAIRAVRQLGPARVIVAAPVIAAATKAMLEREADDVECVEAPDAFLAVGAWYRDFEQTSDEEVQQLLDDARHPGDPDYSKTGEQSFETVQIPVVTGTLSGDLTIPSDPVGLVVFAHGSGSSRRSPRNRDVAAELNQHGLATLLFDLLTEREAQIDARTGEYRFDIALLARRLVAVTDWIADQPSVSDLPLGYFGASTGAAAALRAAAVRRDSVRSVVSRGGRPDLAGDALEAVIAPTLLIVGGDDREVLSLNRAAQWHMRRAKVELEVVPGASHLFEEPGTMESVTRLATDWFARTLGETAPLSEQTL